MLIFDMDGTLIDSNGVWRDVDIAFLKKRGFPYTKEYYQGVAHTIFPKAAVFTKAYCVPVKPGVREYLEQCRRKGERMIVLTSAVPDHCRSALTHLGLMTYFETIFFAHDLNLDKKDPDIFLLAAEKCGVHPAECTLYDDSVDACRGAKAAGMHAVGVYDPYFDVSEAEMRAICDGYIHSFTELLEG